MWYNINIYFIDLKPEDSGIYKCEFAGSQQNTQKQKLIVQGKSNINSIIICIYLLIQFYILIHTLKHHTLFSRGNLSIYEFMTLFEI